MTGSEYIKRIIFSLFATENFPYYCISFLPLVENKSFKGGAAARISYSALDLHRFSIVAQVFGIRLDDGIEPFISASLPLVKDDSFYILNLIDKLKSNIDSKLIDKINKVFEDLQEKMIDVIISDDFEQFFLENEKKVSLIVDKINDIITTRSAEELEIEEELLDIAKRDIERVKDDFDSSKVSKAVAKNIQNYFKDITISEDYIISILNKLRDDIELFCTSIAEVINDSDLDIDEATITMVGFDPNSEVYNQIFKLDSSANYDMILGNKNIPNED